MYASLRLSLYACETMCTHMYMQYTGLVVPTSGMACEGACSAYGHASVSVTQTRLV